MKKIVYQGAPGSFSHMTAEKHFGKESSFQGLRTFHDVFEAIDQGQADVAVIPIENSLIGSIYENYDLLQRYCLQFIGEAYTKVEHCLLATTLPVDGLKGIRKVLSHTKALEQCRKLFRDHPWMEAIVHEDTAGAACDIAKLKDPSIAAIASKSAAELYGLQIVKPNIEDDPQNFTRFVIVSKKGIHPCKGNKCTMSFTLKHEAGSLLKILEALKSFNIMKIESRPLKGKPFEYAFYLDLEIEDLKDALIEKIKEHTTSLQIFGQYMAGAR